MQVPDDLRRIVVFIGVDDDTPGNDGIRSIGTGFLIGYEGCSYLVTAKHNILPLEGAPYKIRVNRTDGSAHNLVVENDADLRWFVHKDRSVDLAIAPFQYDLKKVGSEALFLAAGLEQQPRDPGFSSGAFCYTVGLFQLMSGKKRNLPVVHTGNLALLPGDEKIPVLDWENPHVESVRHVEGFLVEQQSVAGLSGAPVFYRGLVEVTDFPIGENLRAPVLFPRRDLALLGVWQGAWYAPPSEVRSVGIAGNVKAHVGMGVVVPTKKIWEILEMPEPKKQRKALKTKWAAASAASPDSAASPQSAHVHRATDENPKHREDFTSLVNEAARKPPQDD